MDNMSNIIRLANLGVGVAMVLGGITQIFIMTPQTIILGCYVIVFGLGEFFWFLLAALALASSGDDIFGYANRGVQLGN